MIGLGLLGRHLTGLNRIWLVDVKGSRCVTVCPPKPTSNSVSLRGPFWVLCFSRSIPLHWAFLFIGNGWQRSKYLSMFPIGLLGVKTNPAKSACNLGVMFDKNFTFRSHISVVCNSCFYHMQDLWRIRPHLDLDSAILLATALVSSRLDYCNSLFYGIADIYLTRLQRVQNQLARLVAKSPPFARSITLLRSLHWLPVRFRILFEINLLTYKTLREKTACLSSFHSGSIDSFPFTEIKQW